MKFVIRDDDLNYFSTPDDIERWYADIFSQGIPVGFSTIPFVKGTSDVYVGNEAVGNDREYPVGENRALIDYILRNPLIEIMQHGCTHETLNGVFEYQKKSGLFGETARGKQYLENIFKRAIGIFVAPHDQISNHGIRAIEAARLNLIRSKGSKNCILRASYITVLLNMVGHLIAHGVRSREQMPPYPYTIDVGKHREAFSIRLETNPKDLYRAIDFLAQKNGNMVMVTHLHTLTPEKKQILNDILAYAKKAGASFVRPSELFIAHTDTTLSHEKSD